MVVCKFFLQGTCKFGNSCKFDHQINDSSNAHSVSILRQNPPTNTGNVPDLNALVTSVQTDMNNTEKGGQWLLSSYAPFKEKPAFPGFEDKLFEEVRLGFYEATKNGTIEQYKQQLQGYLQEAIMKIRALQNPSQEIVNLLKQIYNTPLNPATSFVQGNTNAFSKPSTFPAGQGGVFSNQTGLSNSQSIFAEQGKPAQSVFSGSPFTAQTPAATPFNQQNTLSPFNQQAAASPFNTQTTNSPFNTQGTTGSPFGVVQQQQNTLGGYTTQASNSPFAQASLQSASPFTQVQSAAQNPSPFTQTQQQTSSLFTQVQAQTPSPFTQAQAQTPSPFTQAQAQTPSPFTQAQAQTPSPFTQAQAQTPSPFTQAQSQAQNPTPFTQPQAQNPSPFAQAQTAAQTQNPSPFAQAQTAVQNQNPSPFAQVQNQASPFAQAQNPSPFSGVMQKQTPFANTSPFSNQSGPILTSKSNSPFASIPGQNTQASQSNSIFSSRQNTVVAAGGNKDSLLYSKESDLTKEELEIFRSDTFQIGCIPEKPPPIELCF